MEATVAVAAAAATGSLDHIVTVLSSGDPTGIISNFIDAANNASGSYATTSQFGILGTTDSIIVAAPAPKGDGILEKLNCVNKLAQGYHRGFTGM